MRLLRNTWPWPCESAGRRIASCLINYRERYRARSLKHKWSAQCFPSLRHDPWGFYAAFKCFFYTDVSFHALRDEITNPLFNFFSFYSRRNATTMKLSTHLGAMQSGWKVWMSQTRNRLLSHVVCRRPRFVCRGPRSCVCVWVCVLFFFCVCHERFVCIRLPTVRDETLSHTRNGEGRRARLIPASIGSVKFLRSVVSWNTLLWVKSNWKTHG